MGRGPRFAIRGPRSGDFHSWSGITGSAPSLRLGRRSSCVMDEASGHRSPYERSWYKTLLVLALLLSACADDFTDARLTVSDSAGVRIAESSREALEAAPLWYADEQLEVDLADERDPAHTFFWVRAGAFLESGAVALADAGMSEVRVFGRSGEHLRSFGRAGRGPGEFVELVDLEVLPGDSIVTLDSGSRRVTVFAPNGEVVRDENLRWEGPGSGRQLLLLGGRRLGVFVGWSNSLAGRNLPTGISRLPRPIYVFDANGQFLWTAATPPGDEMYSPRPNHWIRPLYPRVPVVASRDGQIVLGKGENYELQILEPTGQLTEIIRIRDADVPLSPSDIRAIEERRVEHGNTTPEMRRQARANLDILPVPESAPPYTYIVVDDAGRIWVSDFGWYDPPVMWTVFGRDGGIAARVRVPEQFMLLDVAEDRILGVWSDEFGVEHPQIWRIDKTTEP